MLRPLFRLIFPLITVLFFFFVKTPLTAQENSAEKTDTIPKGYQFTNISKIKATSIKNQAWTGTCWSFATISFLESEIIRMGGDSLDLSEMFIVRHTYPEKAKLFFRYHGKAQFAPGGQAHDVLWVIRNFGLVPESAYSGMNINENKHKHSEMDAILSAIMSTVIKNPNRRVTPAWPQVIESTLDAYLGKLPEKFTWKGKKWTPQSFATYTKLNPDDYIELTSYMHHPFYTRFDLEVPDNWNHNLYYNLPLDELMDVFYNALAKGYSLAWDADMSEKTFNQKKGIAVLPAKEWEDMTSKERDSIFIHPITEKIVTQKYRQQTFDNYTTTDDHLMHIVGLAKDQNGTKYFIVKNSWGKMPWKYKYSGYIYVSEAFVKAKTIAVMVHKNAIPQKIRKKLGL